MEANQSTISNKINATPMYEENDLGPVLYIRHGRTDFNKYLKETSLDAAIIESKFIDCPINDQGIEQAVSLQNQFNTFKISKIFCSPLHRCLETCLKSLENHPDKDKLKVIVHPLISEIAFCNHDFSKRTDQKKAYFNKENTGLDYDWSLFDSCYEDHVGKETYFVKFMDGLPQSEKINELISQITSEENFEQKKYDIIDNSLVELSLIATANHGRPETLNNVFRRNLEFKDMLKKLVAEEVKEGEKILVYTHSLYIKVATSRSAYTTDHIKEMPSDGYKVYNCGVIAMNINAA
jgi:bisphosphoglycerate-dependent phosphoglycerate mutase